MSWVDDISGVLTDVTDVVAKSVDAWNDVVSLGKTYEQPRTVQAQPATAGQTTASPNTDLADHGLTSEQMLWIGGAIVVLVLLLK